MVITNPDVDEDIRDIPSNDDIFELSLIDGDVEVINVKNGEEKNNKQTNKHDNKRSNIFYNLIHKNKKTKVTLLTRDEVGFSLDCKTDPIEAIAQYGTKCAVTDFAIVTGCTPFNDIFVKNEKSLKERTGLWWLCNSPSFCMSGNGYQLYSRRDDARYAIGLRPVIREMGAMFDAQEVIYGEYPQYAASLDLQETLKREYKNKKLKKTNRKYTMNQASIHKDYTRFKPLVLDEYIYNDKKYVRVISPIQEILSNGVEYSYIDEVWIEVSPIKWLVDKDENILISKNILIGGISLVKLKRSLQYKNEAEMFLNKYFINEIKANTIQKKVELKENELLLILNKIKDYQKYYLGSLDVESKVNELIENYNKKLDELSKENSKNIELSIDQNRPRTPEGLYEELVNNLKSILAEVKEYSKKVKDYHKMIDIMNNCKSDKIDINKDEICQDIEYIRVTIIEKFITDSRIKQALTKELNSIIDRNIERNINYIDEFKSQNDIKTKSLDELKLEFRKDFAPFLNKIKEVVEKQDLVNEVIHSTKLMIDNLYVETKNERLKYMFNEINKIKDYINKHGTDEHKEKLTQLLDIHIDLNDDLKTILDNLEVLYKNICNLGIEVENILNKRKKIDQFKVKVNIPEFFDYSDKKSKLR